LRAVLGKSKKLTRWLLRTAKIRRTRAFDRHGKSTTPTEKKETTNEYNYDE